MLLLQRNVIPDLHADPDRLAATLDALGGDAPLAFLGDFIDAGKSVRNPDDVKVLVQVRHLIEKERAVAVMGNHELNAILFHRTGPDGTPLRAHTEKNKDQHFSFCDSLGTSTPAALAWTDWFLTLPLWRDLGGLRLVHACWSESDIALIAGRRPDGCLQPDDLVEVAANATPFARAVNTLVSGPEATLPEGYGFHDSKDHYRREARIAWWRPEAKSWRDAVLSVRDPRELPDAPFSPSHHVEFYPDTAPPVLVGHYKMPGSPVIEAHQAACLDYPDSPCAYRWRGEESLISSNLVIV